MTYKETLFFIGKSLTINHEQHNKKIVEDLLKQNVIHWDNVVKVSTEHYVFPALYCNYKKADFLQYLPTDLVAYMEHITDLNRDRNQQIIEQAKEINELLRSHDITPIFLKGTGNLLEGLYDDVAERMVGDIDFLVEKKNFLYSADFLQKNEYHNFKKTKEIFPEHRHYHRLVKKGRIASVEIHREVVKQEFSKYFNQTKNIKTKIINNTSFLSYNDQLILSIIAKQINDNGQCFNNISLRNAYDVFLLSQKVNSKKSIENLNKKLQIPLNNFLSTTKLVFNSKQINSVENKESAKYLKTFSLLINNKNKREKHNKKCKQRIFIITRLKIIFKALYKKEYFLWLVKRIIRGRE